MASEKELLKAIMEKTKNLQRFSYPGDLHSYQPNPPGSIPQAKQKNPLTPPPIPPRHSSNSHTSGLSSSRYNSMALGYGSPYSLGLTGSNRALFPGYGGGNYNALNYGGRYGYGSSPDIGNTDNIFIRMAEESTRPAFQSIESMVNVVSSISVMLESTYWAVHSSYRAVLGVVDQVSHLRNHLANIMSTLALIRTLQWLYNRFLLYLGLRQASPSAEAAWSAATAAAAATSGNAPLSSPDFQSSWPIFMFMAVVFGAPWLIYRIFSRMAQKKAEEIMHPQELEKGKLIAMFDFTSNHPGEVSVKRGQVLYSAPKKLQPKVSGWTLVLVDNKTSGLVPTTYLRRLVKKSSVNVPSPIPQELTSVMEEAFQTTPEFVEEPGNDPVENDGKPQNDSNIL